MLSNAAPRRALQARFLGRSPGRACLGLASFCLSLSIASVASADVSAWAYAGGGASSLSQRVAADGGYGLLQLEAGVGLSPDYPVVVGGLFRSMTHFGAGTDWALLARAATRGFANGDYGLALDLGGYQRFWGEKGPGMLASLTGGLPWGVNVSAFAGYARPEDHMFGITVGLDWARLTTHRAVGGNWWPNYRLPVPAQEASAKTAW
jgi:hypothetical protein